jgi:hypothetical protein
MQAKTGQIVGRWCLKGEVGINRALQYLFTTLSANWLDCSHEQDLACSNMNGERKAILPNHIAASPAAGSVKAKKINVF